jgi:hypothetical protein
MSTHDENFAAADRAYEASYDAWLANIRCGLCGELGAEYNGVTTDEHDDDSLRAIVRPEHFDEPADEWTDHLVCDECLADVASKENRP